MSEIKTAVEANDSKNVIDSIFEEKKEELLSRLNSLEISRKIINGEHDCLDVHIDPEGKEFHLWTKCADPRLFDSKKRELHEVMTLHGYQRITSFTLLPSKSGGYTAACRAVKLKDELKNLCENDTFEFENDPDVVGKWQIIGEYLVSEDFFSEMHFEERIFTRRMNHIYFLPDGENYWCFEWTRGITRRDNDRFVNDYTLRKIGNELYMFVDLKSYYYRRGGRTTVLVLKRLDNVSYEKKDIARVDELSDIFVNDEKVIGSWKSVDFVRHIEDFSTDSPSCKFDLFFERVEFFENGRMKSSFSNGDIMENPYLQEWTCGTVKNRRMGTASAYVIRELEGESYLFLEWKSGDWIFGGIDCSYYVFKKEV